MVYMASFNSSPAILHPFTILFTSCGSKIIGAQYLIVLPLNLQVAVPRGKGAPSYSHRLQALKAVKMEYQMVLRSNHRRTQN
jgi:hypothetical protein